MAYGTVNADVIQSSVSGVSLGAGNATSFKNRLINGAMVIDQRNAGSAVTINDGTPKFPVDRLYCYRDSSANNSVLTAQQSTDVPTGAGFVDSVKFTVTTAETSTNAGRFFSIQQKIEGNNVSDLLFGFSSAKTVTLSFWVKSSLTGAFGGSLMNSAYNRSYPFNYTISSANTWEQKTITIAGDQSGTWLTDTGIGLRVGWCLGVGSTYEGTANQWNGSLNFAPTSSVQLINTLNATFYITGTQLEVGSSATGFDFRSYGTELALCLRYYEKTYSQGVVPGTSTESNVEWAGTSFQSLASTGTFQAQLRPFKVIKRAAPTMTFWDTVGNQGKWTRYLVGGGPNNNNTVTVDTQDDCGFRMFVAAGSNTSNATGHWTASAEL
jgi:hypothetical protein